MIADRPANCPRSARTFLLTVLFSLAGSPAAAQDDPGPTGSRVGTWQESLAFLAAGSGVWITSNAQYRTADNGEPSSYGMRYWMGMGGTTQHGCLWGEEPGRERTTFWSFFTAWDPTRKQLLVQQSAPNGTIGIGYESPESGIAEQTFTRPDGVAWETRHVSSVLPPDTLVTRSFERSSGGAWEARRTYRWMRQPAGTPSPCG